MIESCSKCNKPVTATDARYQCTNEQCHYYGKLICAFCTETVPAAPPRFYFEGLPVVIAAIGIVTLIFGWNYPIASSIGGVCLLLAFGFIMEESFLWARGPHQVCISCKHDVEAPSIMNQDLKSQMQHDLINTGKKWGWIAGIVFGLGILGLCPSLGEAGVRIIMFVGAIVGIIVHYTHMTNLRQKIQGYDDDTLKYEYDNFREKRIRRFVIWCVLAGLVVAYFIFK